jgi:hypothetical protein
MADDQWTLAQGVMDGQPIIVRMNKSISERRDQQRQMPYWLKIVVPLREPDSNGFARGAEADELEALEERLITSIEGSGEGVLVGVLSSGGIREYMVYARTAEGVSEAVAAFGRDSQWHQIQYAVQRDNEWSAYKEFLG